MYATPARRWTIGLVNSLLACAVAMAATPGVAAAADDEGGTAALREQLEKAARGYHDAQVKLEQSKKRQKELEARIKALDAEIARHELTVDELAATAYKTGGMAAASSVLSSGSPAEFVDRITFLGALVASEAEQVNRLASLRQAAAEAALAVDAEMREQRKQVAAMAQKKREAEKALAQVGGVSTSGFSGGSATAKPAPRNPDGSWPAESCSVDDPTTSGCITPRTLHMLQQAKAAGFTRYVYCWRSGGSGEHPKGRACDFSAQQNGFGGAATGGDRTYGNNLAAYLVRNASRLGVMYVIWYRQIWMASTGWRAYNGSGSPSAEHTNHVHVSMY